MQQIGSVALYEHAMYIDSFGGSICLLIRVFIGTFLGF